MAVTFGYLSLSRWLVKSQVKFFSIKLFYILMTFKKLLLIAVYDRMRADQKKFGKASWAAAAERMEKLQYAVSKETLQMMRAKEICLEQRKHALKEEVTKTQKDTKFFKTLDLILSLYKTDILFDLITLC